MTSFKTLFAQMSKAKRRSLYLLVAIQFVAATIFTIWALLSKSAFSNGIDDKVAAWFVLMATFMPFIDIAYVFISTWQNEKEFGSQTWRLIPISSTKFYLSNITSSIVNGIYLVLMQIGLLIITTIPMYFDHKFRYNIWQIGTALKEASGKGIEYWLKVFPIDVMLGELISFFLFAILVYSIVATIDLSSRTITDFLPEKHSKLVRAIIIIVLVFILIVFGSNTINMFTSLNSNLGHTLEKANIHYYGLSIWFSNLALLIFDFVFSGINIWILNKYHEGK